MEKLTLPQKNRIDSLIKNNEFCDLITYLASFDDDRNLDTLKQSFDISKGYFWEKTNKKQKNKINDILGTANMLYFDLDCALQNFIESGNIDGLENVLHLGKLYGRYDAVKSITDFGKTNNHPSLVLEDKDYLSFLIEKVIPNIQLERDEDNFFAREDIIDNVFEDLKQHYNPKNIEQKLFQSTVQEMNSVKNYDSARKLLLSLYSGDEDLIDKSRKEFNSKKDTRQYVPIDIEQLCEKNQMKLIDQIQEGDKDSYYPLSANLFLIEKDNKKFVLKENIRYKIDFSCLDGYNMELELYNELDHPAFPKLEGVLNGTVGDYLMLEHIEGDQLTKYTSSDNLLDKNEVFKIIGKLAEALDYMHSNAIVYADMKDKNVMYDGKDVRLLDLGMASNKLYIDQSNNEEYVNEVVSNAEYACPETIMMSRVYKKSDVFQLGIMFYKLLTGSHPFVQGTATQDYTQREKELISFSLSNLWKEPNLEEEFFVNNEGITELISSMLDKDYVKRPSAKQVYGQINDFMGLPKENTFYQTNNSNNDNGANELNDSDDLSELLKQDNLSPGNMRDVPLPEEGIISMTRHHKNKRKTRTIRPYIRYHKSYTIK